MNNLDEIPQKDALILIGQLIIKEGEQLIKDLNYQLSRLKTIKNELLKLKWKNINQNSQDAHISQLMVTYAAIN